MTTGMDHRKTPTGIWPRLGRKLARRMAVVLVTLAIVGSAKAAEYAWTGAADDLWGNSANWQPVGVPVSGDLVRFAADAASYDVNLNGNQTASGIVFEAGDDYRLYGSDLHLESAGIEALGSGQTHTIDTFVRIHNSGDWRVGDNTLEFTRLLSSPQGSVTLNKYGVGKVTFNADTVIQGRINILEGVVESRAERVFQHCDVFLAAGAILSGTSVECIRFGGSGTVELSDDLIFYVPLSDAPYFDGKLDGPLEFRHSGGGSGQFFTFAADVTTHTGSISLAENNYVLSDFAAGGATGLHIEGGRTVAATNLPAVTVGYGGILEPGTELNPIGALTAGGLTIPDRFVPGTLAIELGGLNPGSGFDQVIVNGAIDVTSGRLRVTYANGFAANPGDSFAFLSGASISGPFLEVEFPDAQPWYVDYDFAGGAATLRLCEGGADCDANGVPDPCELDSDDDGVTDACDQCPGGDDSGPDADGDGVVDFCDQCLGDDATGDADGDGVCDSDDLCQGADDYGVDVDTDGVPDACDVCDGAADGDVNGDGYINLVDYAGFDDCVTGPAAPMNAGCDCYDLDHDGRVTLADYANFQLSFSGDALVEGPGEISLANMMIDASDKGFALRGEAADDLAGYSVALIGDINGDGLGELLIGAPSAGTGNDLQAGRAYVVYGSENLDSLDLAEIAAGTGGYAVVGAFGNFNHDFYIQEIGHMQVVQDYYDDDGGPQGEGFGFNVNAAGDFNGDGIDDMIITAPYAPANGDIWGGRSYVLLGGRQSGTGSPHRLSDLLLTSNGVMIEGEHGACPDCPGPAISELDGDLSGWASDGIRDFNGDGLADVLIGSPNFGDDNRGRGYVVFGKSATDSVNLADFLTSKSGVLLDVIAPQGHTGFGYRGITTGDLNGDGLGEVWLSPRTLSNYSYVVDGRGLDGAASLNALGALTDVARIYAGDASCGDGSCTGRLMAQSTIGGRGDFNGDGRPDTAIAMVNLSLDEFEIFVLFDAPSGHVNLSANFGPADAPLDPPPSGVRIRSNLWSAMNDNADMDLAGDLNGDGYDDLVLGVNGAGGRRTMVVFGRPGSRTIDLDTLAFGSDGLVIFDESNNPRPGFSVNSEGDFNGDGLNDLALGAPFDDRSALNAGAAYVVYGDDFTSAITHRGDAGDNTLTGTTGADNLVGGRGNDTLDGAGGEDTVYAGAGDDRIVIGDDGFHRVRGGTGYDTLATAGGLSLDLPAVRGRIDEIEEIDLASSGPDHLVVARIDVLNLSPTSNRLVVRGTSEDQVTSLGEAWRFEQAVSDSPYGPVKQFSDGRAELWVSADVALRMSPVIATGAVLIDESLTPGSIAAAIEFYDPDDDGIVSFSIVGGDGMGAFELDAQTGELTVTTALDFETVNAYTLDLEALDGDGDAIVRTVAIAINDVNEAPLLTDQQVLASLAEHAPNGAEIGTFAAADEDGGDTIDFVIDYADPSLTSPAPDGSFAIDTNGVLTVADGSTLDYETLGTVEFIVYAVDAAGLESAGAHVTIDLTDVASWTMPIDGSFVTSNASMWSTDGAQSLDPILWNVRFNLDSPDQGIELFGHTFDASVTGTVDLTMTVGWDPGGVDASIPLAAALHAPDEIVLGQPITVQLDSAVPQDDIVLGGRTPSMIMDVALDIMDFEIQSSTYDVGPYSTILHPSDRFEIADSRSWSADVADDRFAGTTTDEPQRCINAGITRRVLGGRGGVGAEAGGVGFRR